ncbi:MAG: diguanylate cyclase [Actinomycetia bacterium]|nr:diguanylate cyclase [Actinomycetes bacterium]
MREILELCIEMDLLAQHAYRVMATHCDDADLAETFDKMSAEEGTRVGWWNDLLGAWENGLLPDIVSDTDALIERLRSLKAQLESVLPEKLEESSDHEMLATAARIEFFMIDPIFGQLIDLTEPARADRLHQAYSAHLQRLIEAIEHHYEEASLAVFLAGILNRTWQDNMTLAVYATRDPLTGIHNRRALDTHLRQWSAWSARYGRPLGVALVDIDLFKNLNDARGHTFGDQALCAVAEALKAAIRSSDLVVRYGGDEFAIIAPEAEPHEFATLLKRIVNTVRAIDLRDAEGRRIPVSVSAGGAIAVDPPASAPRSPDRLLAAADQSLYSAKQAGRDRVGIPIVLGGS